MRLLAGFIVALFVSVGVAVLLSHDPGYVMVTRGSWIVETSLIALVVGLILAYLALFLLLRLLGRLWSTPQLMAAARRRRAERQFGRGMKSLVEGRWTDAETSLMKSARHSHLPALSYVGAARAATALEAPWRRDSYLRQATKVAGDDNTVVELTRAEFLLADGKAGEAAVILRNLHARDRTHPRVLELLARAYRELGEWQRLKALLPDLHKRKALDESSYADLEAQTWRALLADTARTGTVAELQEVWRQAPERLRHDEDLIIEYAGYLRDNNAATEAENLLQDAVKRQWSDKLAVAYGQLGRGNFNLQLSVAESWLKEHPENPYLLLTLGRLARRCRQNEKARDYFERSIKAMPMPDAYQELAEVLEELNEPELANRCYRNGLRLASGKTAEKAEAPAIVEGIGALPSAGPPPTGEQVGTAQHPAVIATDTTPEKAPVP